MIVGCFYAVTLRSVDQLLSSGSSTEGIQLEHEYISSVMESVDMASKFE